MTRKKNADTSTFLNDAEKIMREYAGKNPQLSVWRGKFPIKILGETRLHETIIVGLSDDKNPSTPPAIPVMKVRLDSGYAEISLETGSSDDVSSFIPFGGGHNPIKDVVSLSQRLPSIRI